MASVDLNPKEVDKVIELLKAGGIGVMPTDTIYGIVGSALNPKTVEEIYTLRKRAPDKPMIILISAVADLKKFGIKLTQAQVDFLKKIWPNPVSIVLPCRQEKFSYLHRGKKSLAFRIPKNEMLLEILKRTGPLVAPSANFEGSSSAETVDEAKKYFGDRVSFYVNKGEIKSKPSTMIQVNNQGKLTVLREGKFKLDEPSGFRGGADSCSRT